MHDHQQILSRFIPALTEPCTHPKLLERRRKVLRRELAIALQARYCALRQLGICQRRLKRALHADNDSGHGRAFQEGSHA